jgi:hypothetical protein
MLVLGLVGSIQGTELMQLDPVYILSWFTKQSANSNVNTIKSKTALPTDTAAEVVRTIPVFFEEQCAIECLRNTYCIRYSFTASSG